MTVKSEDNIPRLLSAAQTMQERVGVWILSLVLAADKFTWKRELQAETEAGIWSTTESRFSPDRRRQAWIQQAVYTRVANSKAQALPQVESWHMLNTSAD